MQKQLHRKYIPILFTLFFILLAVGHHRLVHAADNTLQCSDGACTFVGNNQLFDEASLVPGDETSRILLAENNLAIPISVSVVVDVTDAGGLEDVILIETTDSASSVLKEFSSLRELENSGVIYLSQIQPGQSENYTFAAKFASFHGNEYQQKSVGFDIHFQITDASSNTPLVLSSSDSEASPEPSVLSSVITLPLTGAWSFESVAVVAGISLIVLGLVVRRRIKRLET
ncbi:hypothetical protein KC571_00085 [candidate division WWE3 bacterium]|uniref:LPXTG cell wall anchor domain-containing protein n=1 Tax=candidate division WWE3 bacterium TaxID=2053526 RepID=A0A955RPR9_UNCKA|nr:hypothetical protein [candidate division WWE3 bacterium]